MDQFSNRILLTDRQPEMSEYNRAERTYMASVNTKYCVDDDKKAAAIANRANESKVIIANNSDRVETT